MGSPPENVWRVHDFPMVFVDDGAVATIRLFSTARSVVDTRLSWNPGSAERGRAVSCFRSRTSFSNWRLTHTNKTMCSERMRTTFRRPVRRGDARRIKQRTQQRQTESPGAHTRGKFTAHATTGARWGLRRAYVYRWAGVLYGSFESVKALARVSRFSSAPGAPKEREFCPRLHERAYF